MIDVSQLREFQIKQCHATSGQLNKVMSSCQLKKIIPFNKCQFLTNVCIRMIFISHVPVILDGWIPNNSDFMAKDLKRILDVYQIL